jgi:hypothetical protein
MSRKQQPKREQGMEHGGEEEEGELVNESAIGQHGEAGRLRARGCGLVLRRKVKKHGASSCSLRGRGACT